MTDKRYTKILVRNGERKNLPILDSAEFAFTVDTGQVFIGSNPSQHNNLQGTRVVLSPIPNARKFAQTLLDSHPVYQHYYVSESLHIDTESQERALELMHYINNTVHSNYSHINAIATISSNIELITSKNIGVYTNPSMDVVNYNPTDGFANPNYRVLSKILNLNSGDVFLEFSRRELNHAIITYTLVQNNGAHKRSGTLTLIADNNQSNPFDCSLSDDQTKMTDEYSTDHIRFYTEYSNGKVRIKFEQPQASETKIFYRVSTWGLDSLSDLTEHNISEQGELVAIEVNDGAVLGFNPSTLFSDPTPPTVPTVVPPLGSGKFHHSAQVINGIYNFITPYGITVEKIKIYAHNGNIQVQVKHNGVDVSSLISNNTVSTSVINLNLNEDDVLGFVFTVIDAPESITISIIGE